MSRFQFNATHEDGSDATAELLSFSKKIGLRSAAEDRYSFLLVLQLYGSALSGSFNPQKVVSQIRVLEGLEASNGLKTATLFRKHPLKGLWHQHYLEAGTSSFAMNLQRGLKKHGIPYVDQKIADAKTAGEERYFTVNDIEHIVKDAVTSNYQRLKDSESLTGEWLIFAKHKGRNYYLCIGKHQSGDQYLRDQIDTFCLQEFPFLKSILSEQAGISV